MDSTEPIFATLSLKRKFPERYISFRSSELIIYSGLFAIKDERDAVNQDDFNKAVRKVAESKKLEGKLEYQKL
jgi:hypothetical protein